MYNIFNDFIYISNDIWTNNDQILVANIFYNILGIYTILYYTIL